MQIFVCPAVFSHGLLRVLMLPSLQIGDIGAIVGVLVFRPSLAHDFYRIPQGISILYTGLGMVLAGVLAISMARANRNGNAARATAKERAGRPAVGDRAREYRFQI